MLSELPRTGWRERNEREKEWSEQADCSVRGDPPARPLSCLRLNVTRRAYVQVQRNVVDAPVRNKDPSLCPACSMKGHKMVTR
jgi:hypothetical protein